MIDNETYAKDVEVRYPDNDVLLWQKKESHVIDSEDVQRAIDQKPEIIIIGNGESGVAQIAEKAKKEIESSGIQLIIEKTGDAVKTFNAEIQTKREKIIGLFHLTC